KGRTLVMKLHLMKYAVASAFALGVALSAGTASAQVDFDAGIPETIAITANVANTITANVTAPNLGNLGVIRSAGSTATFALTPAGAQTANANAGAQTVAGGSHAVGVVAITGAFPST